MIYNFSHKLGRNEVCFCGSGRKFKKCCSNIPGYTTSFEITYEPIVDLNIDENFSQDDKCQFDSLSQKIIEGIKFDHKKAIELLVSLKEKYPKTRRLYNLLGTCYEQIGARNELNNNIIETYVKFPDYLFAMTSYVSYWMNQNDYSKFEEVFSGRHDLKSLYPNRVKFHVSEAVTFMGVCGRYFAHRGDTLKAENYLSMIKELRPDSDFINLIESEIMLYKLRSIKLHYRKKGRMKNTLLT